MIRKVEEKNLIKKIPKNVLDVMNKNYVKELLPIQKKALEKNIFEKNKNLIVVSPTGSGKTLIAELLLLNTILNKKKKVVYLVPLKALASEKYKYFNKFYGNLFNIRISSGDLKVEDYNINFDLLIATSEKLDSNIRYNMNILDDIGLVVFDELHLLNDESRGPTLEILLTLLKTKFPRIRIVGLSATLSNAKEIADWLNAILIKDDWRPVELQHYIYFNNELKRYK